MIRKERSNKRSTEFYTKTVNNIANEECKISIGRIYCVIYFSFWGERYLNFKPFVLIYIVNSRPLINFSRQNSFYQVDAIITHVFRIIKS